MLLFIFRRIIGSGFTEKSDTKNVRLNIKPMIYFGSGSSFEFSELRIQAKVPYPTHIILVRVPGIQYLEIIKTPYIQSNKYLSEMFYFILVPVQYTQSRIPRPKLRRTNKLYICSLIFSWSRTINPGPDQSSGSMRIRILNSGKRPKIKKTCLQCRYSHSTLPLLYQPTKMVSVLYDRMQNKTGSRFD